MRVPNAYLSKREQQIMEILYRHDRLSANEILEKMPTAVHNSTIRTQLRILEVKGHVAHDVVDGKFEFYPVHDRAAAAQAAMNSIVNSLFKGNYGEAMIALLSDKEASLSADDAKEIEKLVAKVRK